MKRFLLTFMTLLPSALLFAQICTPDPMYQDSTGVFPMPYDPVVSPDGGINDCAVIGQTFSFQFTVAVGDSITVTVGGIPFKLPLDSVKVTAVQGLPAGLNYACLPGGCKFVKNTIGCAAILGTPTAANTPGDFPLVIKGTAYFPTFPFQYNLSFPDPSFAPGEYKLKLLANNSTPCTVGTKETLADKISIGIVPNPSAGPVTVNVTSELSGNFKLKVTDLLGRAVYQSAAQLIQGANTLTFDGSNLPNGMYVLMLENEQGKVTRKLTIQH